MEVWWISRVKDGIMVTKERSADSLSMHRSMYRVIHPNAALRASQRNTCNSTMFQKRPGELVGSFSHLRLMNNIDIIDGELGVCYWI